MGIGEAGKDRRTHIEFSLLLKALLNAGVLIKSDDVFENVFVLGGLSLLLHLQHGPHSLLGLFVFGCQRIVELLCGDI